jgi:hypothetical protein
MYIKTCRELFKKLTVLFLRVRVGGTIYAVYEMVIYVLYLEESQNLSLVPEDGVRPDSTCWWAFDWV